jgi:hypothetical protein
MEMDLCRILRKYAATAAARVKDGGKGKSAIGCVRNSKAGLIDSTIIERGIQTV